MSAQMHSRPPMKKSSTRSCMGLALGILPLLAQQACSAEDPKGDPLLSSNSSATGTSGMGGAGMVSTSGQQATGFEASSSTGAPTTGQVASGSLTTGEPSVTGNPGSVGIGSANSATSSGGAGAGASTANSTTSAGPDSTDPSEAIYAADQFPRFDITLPPESLEALARVSGPQDPLKQEYVTGTFEYNGESVDNIGVRLKGEGSFRSIDAKMALKLKFDKFVDKQEFRGLRRLTLNNMVEDPSFLAERLAYTVFRAADLPAPRCNSANVYINGEHYGVYANLEAEDKTFLSRWFQDNDGNLYEEGQVDFEPGNEDLFDLETNETENDRSDLSNLIAALAAAEGDNFLSTMDTYLDTEQWLRFTAAEAAVNQWDMYAYTVFWPNNFRIYNDPVSGKFAFLPWGMDMSMKPYRDSGKPHIRIFEIARQYDRAQGPVSAGLMFRRCLESSPCRQSYASAVRAMVTIYESLNLEELANEYYAQIQASVALDPKKEYSENEFDQGFQALLRTVRERPAAMLADLDDS